MERSRLKEMGWGGLLVGAFFFFVVIILRDSVALVPFALLSLLCGVAAIASWRKLKTLEGLAPTQSCLSRMRHRLFHRPFHLA
jgi:hypothetical protein